MDLEVLLLTYKCQKPEVLYTVHYTICGGNDHTEDQCSTSLFSALQKKSSLSKVFVFCLPKTLHSKKKNFHIWQAVRVLVKWQEALMTAKFDSSHQQSMPNVAWTEFFIWSSFKLCLMSGGKFLDIFVSYPWSVHNSRVEKQSIVVKVIFSPHTPFTTDALTLHTSYLLEMVTLSIVIKPSNLTYLPFLSHTLSQCVSSQKLDSWLL